MGVFWVTMKKIELDFLSRQITTVDKMSEAEAVLRGELVAVVACANEMGVMNLSLGNSVESAKAGGAALRRFLGGRLCCAAL